MKNIPIFDQKSDNLIQQFGSLYSIFRNVKKDEEIHFDISKTRWLCPIIVLPVAAYIAKTNSTFTQSENKTTEAYLKTIHFPKGISSATEFEQYVQETKPYVPISILERNKGAERENLESMFSSLIYRLLGSITGAQNAVYYPIAELVTNIFEHSKNDVGFIFGQYYPKKEYLDICIVDTGRGLMQTYKDEAGLELTDGQAIEEVLKGHSTKSQQERGYGIRTSKKVVCEGLNGNFIIVSGTSALVASRSSEKLVSLPDFYWQGVIVAYRIPKPKGSIDISSFLE